MIELDDFHYHLFRIHIRSVDKHSIISLLQRRDCSIRISIIALVDVAKNRCFSDSAISNVFVVFADELLEATMSANFGTFCSEKSAQKRSVQCVVRTVQ